MIDTHAHLYAPELANNVENVLNRFAGAGGKYIINCAASPESCTDVIALAQKHPQTKPTVAIHPELAVPGCDIYNPSISEKWIDRQLDNLNDLLAKHNEIIAVGECGLDYYWIKRERLQNRTHMFDLQKQMLKGCVELGLEHNLPLVLHCRDENGDKQAEAEILELLTKVGKGKTRGVFHSYTGSLSYLKDILALGYYVSFNGILTYRSANNVRELLDATPDDKLLLETDSPYLVPNNLRSTGVKVCEPVFIQEVAEFVAKRRKMRTEKLWEVVEQNAGELFNFV